MTPNIVLLAMVGALYAAGVYMLLERSLTRVLLGLLVMGNATNLLILSAGGSAGEVPIVGRSLNENMADPLAQAMILTAIVIALGMAAFLLAMIYRLSEFDPDDDDVDDDEEDRRIARRSAQRQSRIDDEVEPE